MSAAAVCVCVCVYVSSHRSNKQSLKLDLWNGKLKLSAEAVDGRDEMTKISQKEFPPRVLERKKGRHIMAQSLQAAAESETEKEYKNNNIKKSEGGITNYLELTRAIPRPRVSSFREAPSIPISNDLFLLLQVSVRFDIVSENNNAHFRRRLKK